MYSSMNFDKYIQSWNYHHKQGAEYFYYTEYFPVTYPILVPDNHWSMVEKWSL